MEVFIVSTLLAAVYLTVCSYHRPTCARRTSFVTRAQIRRICREIGTLKEEISQLQEQTIELQNRIDSQGK